ncbi:MAG TPA: ankyrin repeat domain-containing protein [Fimbriimonadaceae bacterium]|jgi:hypothetical protein
MVPNTVKISCLFLVVTCGSAFAQKPPVNKLSVRLIAAIRKKDATHVKALLKAGADPNSTANDGKSALETALLTNDYPIIETLLDGGANVKKHAKNGMPLLTMSVSKQIMVALLKHGADPNEKFDKIGDTYLQACVEDNNVAIAAALLENGANPNVDSNTMETPLDTAVSMDKVRMVELLLDHGADANGRNYFNTAPLATLAIFTSSDNKNDKYPDAVTLAKLLIAHGAKVNARDDMVRKVLFNVEFDYAQALGVKIKKHFDLSVPHEDGASALDYASYPPLRDYLISIGGKAFLHEDPWTTVSREVGEKN